VLDLPGRARVVGEDDQVDADQRGRGQRPEGPLAPLAEKDAREGKAEDGLQEVEQVDLVQDVELGRRIGREGVANGLREEDRGHGLGAEGDRRQGQPAAPAEVAERARAQDQDRDQAEADQEVLDEHDLAGAQLLGQSRAPVGVGRPHGGGDRDQERGAGLQGA